MRGTDVVKAIGRDAVEGLQEQAQAGRLRPAELEITIGHWRDVQKGYAERENPEAALAAGEVITQLMNLQRSGND